MNNRPTTLVFAQSPHFFPAGAPLDTWEVQSDSNCTYEIEANGRLVRKNKFDGSRWVSPDFTGSFTVSITPRYAQAAQVFVLFVVCGTVTNMHQTEGHTLTPLVSCKWKWMLEALVVDKVAVDASQTYAGCIQIITQAQADPGFKTGDPRLDSMIGMALCRPALIEGKSPRNALECLSVHQLRAVTGWVRATISV
ncbi:hypothetical protein F2S72_09630 [Pseudomonas syringae pv. actinidiae]|nr:hypothetical protein [Pseudomonas syringae pv. actinidiae]